MSGKSLPISTEGLSRDGVSGDMGWDEMRCSHRECRNEKEEEEEQRETFGEFKRVINCQSIRSNSSTMAVPQPAAEGTVSTVIAVNGWWC